MFCWWNALIGELVNDDVDELEIISKSWSIISPGSTNPYPGSETVLLYIGEAQWPIDIVEEKV